MKFIGFLFFFSLLRICSAQVLLPMDQRKSSPPSDEIPAYILIDPSDNIYREGKVEIIKDERLDFLIDQYNKNKETEGYRIQIYSGNNREEAMKIRADFMESYPNINTHLIYQQPNFKVRLGDFINRLEATKFFRNVRYSYPSSFVIRDEISLKKSIKNKDR